MFLSHEGMNTVLKLILYTHVCHCGVKRLTYKVKGKRTEFYLWDSFMSFLTNAIDKSDRGKKSLSAFPSIHLRYPLVPVQGHPAFYFVPILFSLLAC